MQTENERYADAQWDQLLQSHEDPEIREKIFLRSEFPMSQRDTAETAECLKRNKEKILTLWSERARQEVPAAGEKDEYILRDAIPLFLDNLGRALSPTQPASDAAIEEVSKEHGRQRAQQGDYSLPQVLDEYFILQKTILEVLEVELARPLSGSVRETILESIARGITEAGTVFAERQVSILKKSNEALEHFAHIASHDLQEPLRMIFGYLTLLEKDLGPHLDVQTQKYFGFALNGARRMKSLIDGLLLYSQVGRDSEVPVLTDFNLSLSHAMINLQEAIKDSGAELTSDPLPTLVAHPVEIERLFQNLISNAIKFRSNKPPVIHITAVQNPTEWVFCVSDNGIGIKENNRNQIFKLFSRLHNQDQYPGSGIGLSVCRRVVEIHGGTIWIEQNPTGGTLFKFSIACTSKG